MVSQFGRYRNLGMGCGMGRKNTDTTFVGRGGAGKRADDFFGEKKWGKANFAKNRGPRKAGRLCGEEEEHGNGRMIFFVKKESEQSELCSDVERVVQQILNQK